jgi:hypothetical protein
MPNFVKLYGSILDSTIWLEPLPTKVVWITMLAMADADGCVVSSIPSLAKRAGVSREEVHTALATLAAPDPDSKTSDHEGRRIERVDGGWLILNHRKYRDMRTDTQIATAERVRKYRERHKQGVTVTNVTKVNGQKRAVRTEAEAYTEEEADKTKTTTSAAPKRPTWVTEGASWWSANVGVIAEPRFGKGLKDAVVTHGWPKVFSALKEYTKDAKHKGKPAKLEWFASELIRWIEWASMPATDNNGDLTPRGRAIMEGR